MIVRGEKSCSSNLVEYSFHNVGTTLLTTVDAWPAAILMHSEGTLTIKYDFVASYTIVCTLLLTNVSCVSHLICTQKLTCRTSLMRTAFQALNVFDILTQ